MLLTLAFTSAPYLKYLTSPAQETRRTVLQKVRGSALFAVPQLVNTGFQVLFHSPPGVLFTFPSQYFSSIGHQVVFRLGGWSPLLPGRFLVSARTLDPAGPASVSLTGLSPSLADLPMSFCYSCRYTRSPKPLRYCYLRFSLFRFRSPLLTESRLISLPEGT